MNYTIQDLAYAKGTSAPVREALLSLEARVNRLEAALREIVDNCGECGGYGTYPTEDTVTEKVLWWDCSSQSCTSARAALSGDV